MPAALALDAGLHVLRVTGERVPAISCADATWNLLCSSPGDHVFHALLIQPRVYWISILRASPGAAWRLYYVKDATVEGALPVECLRAWGPVEVPS